MYEEKEGFLYQPVSTAALKNTKGHTWESPVSVPVILAEHIPNVYAEILREETAENVISTASPISIPWSKNCTQIISGIIWTIRFTQNIGSS